MPKRQRAPEDDDQDQDSMIMDDQSANDIEDDELAGQNVDVDDGKS